MSVSERTRLATLNERVSRPSSQPHTAPQLLAGGIGGFQLAENLRLAHHHRIQAGRHAEQMVDGVLALMPVEMRRDGPAGSTAL